jgi:hypothetical protein
MSTDAVRRIDEARGALRETVQRLAEIADGLRGEPELPPEPPIGSVVLVGVEDAKNPMSDPLRSFVYRRYDDAWFGPGEEDRFTWGQICRDGTPVLLVRADQTVVLPDPPLGEIWAGRIKAEFLEPPDGPRRRLRLTIWDGGVVFAHDLDPAIAERWLLEVIALVRSKGGAS